MEKHASLPITMLAKNLLFWHIRINQLKKFNLLWKSFSVNCCLTRIWCGCHLIFFPVLRLNNNAEKPSPFYCALTCGLFSSNSQILSMFSSVIEDRLLLEFPLLLFRLPPKLRYFVTLHWTVLLLGALRLNHKLNCCRTWLILLLSIYFSTINIRSSVVNWGIFFFNWLVSRT